MDQVESRIIIALDGLEKDDAIKIVERVGYRAYAVKIHNLFDRYGGAMVAGLRMAGAERVWVDAKLHDIPNTVAHRAKAISDAGANILTVHASGGVEMIEAAVKAFDGEVFAVTVLTSLNEQAANEIFGKTVDRAVGDLAKIAFHGGAHGLVCSPQEVGRLSMRSDIGNQLNFIVPGIRPAGANVGDQKRVGTPGDALKSGAHRLVIGRPIIEAADPVAAFEAIEREIAEALK